MKKFFNRSSSMFFTAVLSSFLVLSSPAQTIGKARIGKKNGRRQSRQQEMRESLFSTPEIPLNLISRNLRKSFQR